MRGAAVLGLALILAAGPCASAAPGPPKAPASDQANAGRAVTGGVGGLGLSGADTPELLKDVAAAPYGLPQTPTCGGLVLEIAVLDQQLGPDVDVPAARARNDQVERWAGSAIRGAIPYRWAVRWMTGAGRKDRDLRDAIAAAVARRGYLKGVARGLGCPPP